MVNKLVDIAPMFFDHRALMVEPRRLSRVDHSDQRYYFAVEKSQDEVGVTIYHSVTSVLGKTLPTPPGVIDYVLKHGSREAARADLELHADYGTWLHSLAQRYCIEGRLDLSTLEQRRDEFVVQEGLAYRDTQWIEDAKNDMLCFAEFIHDRNVVPLAVEVVLGSDTWGIAGAIDLLCELDWNGARRRAIVDWKKTRKGFYHSHALQLAAYREIARENFPDFGNDLLLFNWGPKEFRGNVPTYNLKDQSDVDGKNWMTMQSLIRQYTLMYDADTMLEKTNIRSYSGVLTFGESAKNNIKTESIFDVSGVTTRVPIMHVTHSDEMDQVEVQSGRYKVKLKLPTEWIARTLIAKKKKAKKKPQPKKQSRAKGKGKRK